LKSNVEKNYILCDNFVKTNWQIGELYVRYIHLIKDIGG